MGEVSDMMLDGTLCEGCGEYLGTGPGYVRRCTGCGGTATIEDDEDEWDEDEDDEDWNDDEDNDD